MSMADTSAAPSATPLVSARGISKQFGGVEALTDGRSRIFGRLKRCGIDDLKSSIQVCESLNGGGPKKYLG
jgi:hypothetical protein